MTDFKSKLQSDNIPKHVAIIMDGNGRWAKQNGQPRVFGHKNGVDSVRDIVEAAAEIDVKWLTLYAFSTENWNRPSLEVEALMTILVNALHQEIKRLMDNNIRLQAIGELPKLPEKCYHQLMEGIEKTKHNSRMTLVLALSYSGRWELTEAVRNIARDVYNDKLHPSLIDEHKITEYLTTKNMPDPELLIRTSGETRISNFLLWQLAYSEMYFTNKMWPEFRKNDFFEAIYDYQNRERRFGKTSEQL